MNSDGISYLDVGDAFMRGDWLMAINAYWSPLYSWLLGVAMLMLRPSPYWEFSVAHLVSFATYLGALAAFDFFLLQLIRYDRRNADECPQARGVALPEWVMLMLGYTLFVFFSLGYISIWLITPDMLLAATVYLAAGLLLRIRLGHSNWQTFAALGVVLGCGYLVKTIMLPLSLIFLAVACWWTDTLRTSRLRPLIALTACLLIVGPFVGALSLVKNRLTVGDSSRLSYAWWINEIPKYVHWQGDRPGNGVPEHPTRKIFVAPPIYEFGTPIGGTYPPWFDPTYWHEGVRLHFDLPAHLRALRKNLQTYFKMLFRSQGLLILGLLALLVIGNKWRLFADNLSARWGLLAAAIPIFGLYSIVSTALDARYFAPFFLLLWMILFSSVRLPSPHLARKTVTCIIAGMLLGLISLPPSPTPSKYRSASLLSTSYGLARDLIEGESSAHPQSQVAATLGRAGLQPGDKVAVVGNSFKAFWARLARVRIVAEIPSTEVVPKVGGDLQFWMADDAVRSQALQVLAGTGAKVVVAYLPTPRLGDYAETIGWQRLGPSDYYAYTFRAHSPTAHLQWRAGTP